MTVEARLREKEDERRKKSGEVAADFVSKMFSSSSNKSMLGMMQAEDEEVLAAASAKVDDACSAATDRKVLLLFFKATEGERWRRSTHWGTDEDVSEWYGISCDADGRVTDIDLGENNLSGRLPMCIGRLDKLLSLYLDYNYIRGALPPTLSHCTGLRDLCLNNNLLMDTIPSSLAQLRDLEILNLESNQFVGEIPDSLGALSRLVCLDLRWNAISGAVPASLGECRQLQELWLQGNQLAGELPPTLGNLPNLEWLGLSQNAIEGVEESRQMFQGKYGSRVGIFLDSSDGAAPRRKRSAPPAFMLEPGMSEQDRRAEDRFRRVRRHYSKHRGSLRRASMQVTGEAGSVVDFDAPHSMTARSAYEQFKDDETGRRYVHARAPRRGLVGLVPDLPFAFPVCCLANARFL